MAYYNQGRMSPADYYNEQQQNQRSNLQNVLNMVMMMKQHKMNQAEKQKEQERYAKEYSDKQAQWQKGYELDVQQQQATEDYRTKQLEIAGRPKAPTIDERRQGYADFLYKNNELTDEEYKQYKLTTTLPKKEGLTTYQKFSQMNTEMGRNQGRARNKISDINRRIGKLKEPMSMAEITGRALANTLGEVDIDEQGIKNLEKALSFMSRFESIAYDRVWDSTEKRILTYIAGNLGEIEKKGLQTSTNPKTGVKHVLINGKWIEYR